MRSARNEDNKIPQSRHHLAKGQETYSRIELAIRFRNMTKRTCKVVQKPKKHRARGQKPSFEILNINRGWGTCLKLIDPPMAGKQRLSVLESKHSTLQMAEETENLDYIDDCGCESGTMHGAANIQKLLALGLVGRVQNSETMTSMAFKKFTTRMATLLHVNGLGALVRMGYYLQDSRILLGSQAVW